MVMPPGLVLGERLPSTPFNFAARWAAVRPRVTCRRASPSASDLGLWHGPPPLDNVFPVNLC